jgi:adenylosuccinate synthase
MRGGLLPEIEQLASKGCPINGRLFIAEDTPMIGYHHILIDAFLEQARESKGLNPIGSTGTGISPAYSTVPLRNDVSIASALRNPDEYFRSMHAEWMPYAQYFPHISIDTLIEKQEDQIEKLRTFLNNGTIKIGDERAKIDELRKEKKSIVGE